MEACENRIADLVDAASGSLEPARRAELDAHLATCAGCRAELEALRSATDALESTRFSPDPLHLAGFAARTADRAEAFRDRSARGLWWGTTRAMRFALSACAGALAASLVLLVAARTVVTHDVHAPAIATTAPAPDDDAAALDADVLG